jgi:alkanesulfonate monooxygenase SsuD/methylene tetrahydromethanopterin reductase-like flavin-dependent oxidoreductase (luciferase family)
MAMITLRYDLRIPPGGSATSSEQYAAFMDQVRWGDRVGLDMVVLSEHHGTDDGFMPAPVTLAAAVGAATERISINISALLGIMHDPVRMAEQLATADLICRGRMSVIVGTGYRQEEFDMYGIEFKDRYRLLEEFVTVLRAAWTGEYFDYRGRQVKVRPLPHTAGGPMLMLGGSTPVAARRAARLKAVFVPSIGDQELARVYREECEAVGYQGFASLPNANAPGFVHVSDDPERDWARIGVHAMHEAQTYDSWQRAGQDSTVHVHNPSSLDAVRKSGVYAIVTPDECVALANEVGVLVLHPLMGGMSPELGWEGLELFEKKVLPRLRPAAVAAE